MQCDKNITNVNFEMKVTLAKIRLDDLRKILDLKLSAVIERINFFMCHKKNNHLYSQKFWCYQSLTDFAKALNVNLNTISRYLKKLYNLGVIKYEKFNKSKGDVTKFYTINYDKLEELGIRIKRKTRVFKIPNNNDIQALSIENKENLQSDKSTDSNKNQNIILNDKKLSDETLEQVKSLTKEYDIAEWQVWPLIKNKSSETLINVVSYCRESISNGKIKNPIGFIISALRNGYEDQKVKLDKRLQQEQQIKEQDYLDNIIKQLETDISDPIEKPIVQVLTNFVIQNQQEVLNKLNLHRLSVKYKTERIIKPQFKNTYYELANQWAEALGQGNEILVNKFQNEKENLLNNSESSDEHKHVLITLIGKNYELSDAREIIEIMDNKGIFKQLNNLVLSHNISNIRIIGHADANLKLIENNILAEGIN